MVPPGVEVAERLDAATLRDVTALLATAERADGHRALSEQMRLLLTEPVVGGEVRPDVARADVASVSLVARTSDGSLVGYAQLAAEAARRWSLEVAVSPGRRDPSDGVGQALLSMAVSEVRRRGGETVRLWVFGAEQTMTTAAAEAGFSPVRALYQLRVRLPLPRRQRATERRATEPLSVRPFRPGADEDAWLRVNGRAFASHPEQGRWGRDDLLRRQAEPWFDPAGFLLHEETGELAGFCWTKVHHHATPVLGEIYVIGVDPAYQGRGLGRALTVAGLDYLASVGITDGMLYVDGDNGPARALYRSLGFAEHHVDCELVLVLGTVGED